MKNVLVLAVMALGLIFVGNANAFGGRSVSSQKIVTRNVQQVRVQPVKVQQVRVQQVKVQQQQQLYYVPVQPVQQLNQHCPQNIQGLRSY